MKNIEKLQEKHPELVQQYAEMTKSQLLETICGEVLDLLDMQERVAFFMDKCTNMSKTTYTIESLDRLITEHKEQEFNENCFIISDEQSDASILREVKERARKFLNGDL